jgi:hypothetical protein
VCTLEEERAAFLEQLVAAARDRDRRALVLCSLRADFYGRLASFPAFAELLSASHVLVVPMDRDELVRAIEQRAARAGLEVERTLVDTLVADVAGEPGGLPLLSTTLLELWRTRDGRTLRYDSYHASGGVRGAVARLAEAAYTHLTDARLLTVTDGEVELSHEALLREWPRYRSWLEQDRAGRRLHAHLTTSAREWTQEVTTPPSSTGARGSAARSSGPPNTTIG